MLLPVLFHTYNNNTNIIIIIMTRPGPRAKAGGGHKTANHGVQV